MLEIFRRGGAGQSYAGAFEIAYTVTIKQFYGFASPVRNGTETRMQSCLGFPATITHFCLRVNDNAKTAGNTIYTYQVNLITLRTFTIPFGVTGTSISDESIATIDTDLFSFGADTLTQGVEQLRFNFGVSYRG